MAPKRALMNCNITLFGRNPSWEHATQSKVGNWLSHLSGRLVSFGDNTTHLVVSKKRWDEHPRPSVLLKALSNHAKNKESIKILTFDWLEDCLNSQSRKREQPYEWLEIEAQAAKVTAKDKKAKEREEKRAAKNVPGMLSEVFHESTDPYVDPVEARKLEKQMEREREERKKREQEEKEERVRRKKEQARIFGRGAVKARNQALSDTYHIYSDTTGFKYDVLVTKVDARANKNERWALSVQIFESNTEPHNYATNTQISGTELVTASNVVSAMGTTYLTAFHAFKCEFYARTGIEWEERISAHIRGLRQKRIDQGRGTGSEAPGSVCGVPVSEAATREVPFGERRFEYHPPGYGPKGEVTDEERARCKALGVTLVDNTSEKNAGKKVPAVVPIDEEIPKDMRSVVEEWMKGADMSTVAPDEQEQQPPPPHEQEMDFGAMLAAGARGEAGAEAEMAELGEDYPFEKALDEAVDQHHGVGAAQAIENGVFETTTESAADNTNTQLLIDHEDSAIGLPADNTFDGLGDFSGGAVDESWMLQDSGSADGAGRNDDVAENMAMQQEHDSVQAEMPTFTTHPNTSGDTSFQHGTQEIGETQVAEKVGGEFLEDLAAATDPTRPADRQLATPPASTKKPVDSVIAGGSEGDSGSVKSAGSKGGFGGLNLGSSILGKRKVGPAVESDSENAKKAARIEGKGDVAES